MVTGSKYDFRVLDENGQWQKAIQCPHAMSCFLDYPEFTAIYPTGSVKSSTKDQYGNVIPTFSTQGLWEFLSRSYHDVDNIRAEPYYGWIPKMDFQAVGNGFHNPAVRFYGASKSVKAALGIPAAHNTFWAAKRGGVSHGCLRLPAGGALEMRQIFPVENAKMTQIHFFASNPRDFDIYDIDGDGKPEIMGVQYMISYDLKGADGIATREGANLEVGTEGKLRFYENLYGARNVFTTDKQGDFLFKNPSVSLPSYLDFQKRQVAARLTFNGTLPLYEAGYERDKLQFYLPYSTDGLTETSNAPLSKRFVRLLDRIKGCAPGADKTACGEAAFDKEAASILGQIR
jgi:hypothetical protein